MKYLAILCATITVAACSKKNNATVSDTAGGAVAPATATTGGDTLGTSSTSAKGTDTSMSKMNDTSMSKMNDTSSTKRDTTGASSDTTASKSKSGASSDTTGGHARNQTQSGMTNTRTGHSTLGHRVKKTTPTQGQPVTAKGDTLKAGADTSHR